jgi:hypothetical protein
MFGVLRNLAQTWNLQHIIMNATGVGEGLWAMLDHAYPARVIPVKFSQVVKSEIGWRFISIIETGRFRDYAQAPEVLEQYRGCQKEVLIGSGKIMRWGIPDGTRGADGEPMHDDAVLSDSLVAVLDRLE